MMKRKGFLLSLGALLITPFLPVQKSNIRDEENTKEVFYLDDWYRKCPRCQYENAYLTHEYQTATTRLFCPQCQMQSKYGARLRNGILRERPFYGVERQEE